MITSVAQLANYPPFSAGFTAGQLDLIAGISSAVGFRAGQHLWRQGEIHETCYLIQKGQLALEIYVPMHGPINVDTISAGELLGGSGLLSAQKWSFDARALTDIQAISIDCLALGRLTEEDHEFGYRVFQILARTLDGRLATARRRLLELSAPRRG